MPPQIEVTVTCEKCGHRFEMAWEIYESDGGPCPQCGHTDDPAQRAIAAKQRAEQIEERAAETNERLEKDGKRIG